jgi:hypothetical protein
MSGDDKKSHRGLCKDLCFKVLVAFNSRHLQLPGSDYSRKLEAAIDDLSIHTLDNEVRWLRRWRFVHQPARTCARIVLLTLARTARLLVPCMHFRAPKRCTAAWCAQLGVRVFRYVKTHLSARHALEDKGGKPSITKELRLVRTS